MKTTHHTIWLPGLAPIGATIVTYGPRDVTQPQHDDLYRPDGMPWGIATIDHEAFKNRVWTVSTDTMREATRQLQAEVEDRARAEFGLPPVNPFTLLMAI